ncbi:MAG: hypothetical protein OXF67_07680 [Cyanobacteria bacterium MAG CAR4_bin_6]|nr:hypothetical protein [Cyanobacteria bacterium MAG CAR4_bin_6]
MTTSSAPSSKSDREELRRRIESVYSTMNSLQIHEALFGLHQSKDISDEDKSVIMEQLSDHDFYEDGPDIGRDLMEQVASTDWQLAKDILREKIDDLLLEDKEDNKND